VSCAEWVCFQKSGLAQAAFTRLARRVARPAVLRPGHVKQASDWARFNGLLNQALAKAINQSALKRASIKFTTPVPGAKSAGLITVPESLVNEARTVQSFN